MLRRNGRKNPGRAQNSLGWSSFRPARSTRRSLRRARRDVADGTRSSDDPSCSWLEHFYFRAFEPVGTTFANISMTIPDTDTQLCVSSDVYVKYEDVIRRPRFARSNRPSTQGAQKGPQRRVWPSEWF